MGPPDSRKQQLVHLLGTKVGYKLAAMDFIQKYLPTGSRYHQPRSLIGASKHKFKAMQLPYMQLGMGATCPTTNFLHFHVSILPRGLVYTC